MIMAHSNHLFFSMHKLTIFSFSKSSPWPISVSAVCIMLTISVVMFFIPVISGIDNALLLSLILPLKITLFLQKIGDLRQKIYNKICLFILDIPLLSTLLILYHTFLLNFRVYSMVIGNYIEKYININIFAMILGTICSKFHVAGYMIMLGLLFIKLDLGVLSMARFYKQYPLILDKHMPGIHTSKRPMYRVIQEAAQNPQVQAVVAAGAVAVAWKALDVYEVYKSEDIATADRESMERQATADREAMERQATADREQADRHHRNEMAKADADREEARLSRAQAERHHQDSMGNNKQNS
jgi:hypothetical protein